MEYLKKAHYQNYKIGVYVLDIFSKSVQGKYKFQSFCIIKMIFMNTNISRARLDPVKYEVSSVTNKQSLRSKKEL